MMEGWRMDYIQMRIEQIKIIIRVFIKVMDIITEYFPTTSSWVFR